MSNVPEIQSNELSTKPVKNKKKFISILILGGIPLLFILYLILGPILDILSKDLKAKEMFVVSEFVNVRATSDVNSLKMGKLDYGTKVLVYEIKDDWAEVLVEGQKVFISSKFIVEPQEFYTIEGIFDEGASKIIKNSKYRLALYRYFESKGFTSNISEDIQNEYFGGEIDKEAYQIYSEPRGSLYNSSSFADFDGNFLQDAAFVLKQKDTDTKILIILSFDKKEPLENSKIIYEQELDEPWMFIRLAKKGSRFELDLDGTGVKKTKIPVNGLLIGSNRSKDLNDPVQLLLYDGTKFGIHSVEK